MLSRDIKPFGFNTWEKEEWEDYRKRLDLPDDEATLEFYRQVVYDHFEHFNEHYPKFHLSDYSLATKYLTAQEAYDKIRFFGNKIVDMWNEQYDYFKGLDQPYLIYQGMSKNLTPPFPPILIESSLLFDNSWRVYGRDTHLIEGTHRVSYLRRMMDLDEVAASSRHKFVILTPRSTDAA